MQEKKITRREFLKFCARTGLAIAAWTIMPLDPGFTQDEAGRRRFTIKVKPFKVSDLYRKHDLAG